VSEPIKILTGPQGLEVFTPGGEKLDCQQLNIYWEPGQPVVAQIILEASLNIQATRDGAWGLLNQILACGDVDNG
jgi:hypothetical protein